MGAAGKGKSMQSLLNLQPGENVRAILPMRDLEEEGKFIFFATRKAPSRRLRSRTSPTSWRAASSPSPSTRTMNWSPRDITDGKQTIFLATREGMAIRFEEEYDPERAVRPPSHGPQCRRKQGHFP